MYWHTVVSPFPSSILVFAPFPSSVLISAQGTNTVSLLLDLLNRHFLLLFFQHYIRYSVHLCSGHTDSWQPCLLIDCHGRGGHKQPSVRVHRPLDGVANVSILDTFWYIAKIDSPNICSRTCQT